MKKIDLLLATMRSEITVSDDQLTIAYQLNKDRFATPEQLCASHILLASDANVTETTARMTP